MAFVLWAIMLLPPPIFLSKTRVQIRYRFRWYLAALASGALIGGVLVQDVADGIAAIFAMILALRAGQEIGRYEAHAEGAEPPGGR